MKMIKQDREYRSMAIVNREAIDTDENNYIVRGYASTFEPYVLFTVDGVNYSERIAPEAFDNTDFSDCIFKVNHVGNALARTKNNSVKIEIDEKGLYTEADLSLSQEARNEYEVIKNGLRDQMSFAFVVAPDGDVYDRNTHTRTIHNISKVFDVSSVDIPANGSTYIETVSTRDYFNGVIEMEKTERLEHEKMLALAKAKFEF